VRSIRPSGRGRRARGVPRLGRVALHRGQAIAIDGGLSASRVRCAYYSWTGSRSGKSTSASGGVKNVAIPRISCSITSRDGRRSGGLLLESRPSSPDAGGDQPPSSSAGSCSSTSRAASFYDLTGPGDAGRDRARRRGRAEPLRPAHRGTAASAASGASSPSFDGQVIPLATSLGPREPAASSSRYSRTPRLLAGAEPGWPVR